MGHWKTLPTLGMNLNLSRSSSACGSWAGVWCEGSWRRQLHFSLPALPSPCWAGVCATPTSNHSLPGCLAFCLLLHFKLSFHIGSILFTKKKKIERGKKSAPVCSGCGASGINVLPPVAATAGIANSVRATWAGGTKHVIACPLSSILLQTPSCLQRDLAAPGQGWKFFCFISVASCLLCKPYCWVQLCRSSSVVKCVAFRFLAF